ncbi:MAG: efflux RND transporter periplasmic adaptor subunit, partial [Bryobacterales bacterium]|nr:efflux RND transporter periplasmic adaptor subunit [Bryobacterales bacterium]
ELSKLRIDKTSKQNDGPSPWAVRWILAVIALFVVAGVGGWAWTQFNQSISVRVQRVTNSQSEGAAPVEDVVLNATGYIIAAHKIQVASKVVGRVRWIGVEKGDRVRQGQVIVRLEDDEYRAQLQQAQGRLKQLQAQLQELEAGSRPQEIAVAQANLNQARAELERERLNLDRIRKLVAEGVFARQQLDDATAAFGANEARVQSLAKSFELVEIGPRAERIAAVRGQLMEAQGSVAFFETQLSNTLIKAPVDGTVLERNVEIGEFVTTSFVGERGAKGYVVSMADLNDLQVELDISQNDFGRIGPRQKAVVTTDAYPDRKYAGEIQEISPEANRQKATVQVKVQILQPDALLRPDMNASVAFLSEKQPEAGGTAGVAAKPVIFVPATAVRDGTVFLVLNGKAVARRVTVGGNTSQGLRIEDGLIGGEDLILNPPDGLEDGARIQIVGER